MVRSRQTNKILEFIKDINNSNLSSSALLLIIGVVNILSSINDNMGIASVWKYLDEKEWKYPPAHCVFEAYELCYSCNNTAFNNNNYL